MRCLCIQFFKMFGYHGQPGDVIEVTNAEAIAHFTNNHWVKQMPEPETTATETAPEKAILPPGRKRKAYAKRNITRNV